MELSIITVTYQSVKYIDSCIMSVVGHTLCEYEHLIVDNGSTDGTVELVESYASYVRLIKNKKNVGFAAANNQAFKEAKGRYILFLNPDLQIHEGRLDDMIDWMDKHSDVGIAGCKLLNHDYEPSLPLKPIRFPTPLPFLPFFLNQKRFNEVLYYTHILYPNFDDNQIQEIDHARGAFLLTRREILEKLGFAFDPAYFIYFEDVDLYKEVKRLGYKTYYVPLVACVDHFGRSFALRSNTWKYFQMAKSFKTYTAKWFSPLHLLWLNLVIPLGYLIRLPKWIYKRFKRRNHPI